MEKHEVHVLKKDMGYITSDREGTREFEEFMDKKVSEGYEIVNTSFIYHESLELIAFITIAK